MSGQHTPGPWRVEDGTTLVWGNCNPDDRSTYGMGYPIAECRINPSGNWSSGPYADEAEANARLIAAAPELLEAIDGLLNALPSATTHPAIKAARAAIAKATGGAA